MSNNFWTYNPKQYTNHDFELIPEGNHRVRIKEVTYKVFSNGKNGFEIMLEVSGYGASRIWHYITLDPEDPQRTNQRLGSFFDSFAITDYNLANYQSWIGKMGAVRVKHSIYNGSKTATTPFCLGKLQQKKLPVWNDNDSKMNNNFCSNTQTSNGVVTPTRAFDGFKGGVVF
jgi:hypothetical protein